MAVGRARLEYIDAAFKLSTTLTWPPLAAPGPGAPSGWVPVDIPGSLPTAPPVPAACGTTTGAVG